MEAYDMNSPNIPTKKCATCLRHLTYDHFGELTKSPDGYGHSCKGCRKDISARTYQNKIAGYPNKIEAHAPLRWHNTSTLDSRINGRLMGEYLFKGEGVNDDLTYDLSVSLLSANWIMTIMKTEEELALRNLQAYPNIGWTNFRTMIGELLFQMEIRLAKEETQV